MSNAVAERVFIGADNSGELVKQAVMSFDFVDYANTSFWRRGGQGWMSTLGVVDSPSFVFIDMMTYHESTEHARDGIQPRISISVVSELGEVTIDSALGIRPDRHTGLTPTPKEASERLSNAIIKLTLVSPDFASTNPLPEYEATPEVA